MTITAESGNIGTERVWIPFNPVRWQRPIEWTGRDHVLYGIQELRRQYLIEAVLKRQ